MKLKKIGLIILIIVLFIILLLLSLSWYGNKMARVKVGTARPTFPYSDYTIEEANKLYPQYIENNAPTTQTPEETHKKFVEALKKGNIDDAVKCCVVGSSNVDFKESLEQIKKDNLLSKMISDLDRTIKELSKDSNKAIYSYTTVKNGENFGHRIYFIKDDKGVWLIESL